MKSSVAARPVSLNIDQIRELVDRISKNSVDFANPACHLPLADGRTTRDRSGKAVIQDSLARRARNAHIKVISAESVFQHKIAMAPLHLLTRFFDIIYEIHIPCLGTHFQCQPK
jgi:hypothetical protein